MACNVLERNAFEMETRKRKRKTQLHELAKDEISSPATATTTTTTTGFTNAAFSSTPKKLTARRRIIQKENSNIFQPIHNLEVKSISDIVNEKQHSADTPPIPTNPFEVARRPAKKKKKCENEIVQACFENQALNLEVPEKQFNPFEVQRLSVQRTPQCFVNEALNIRGQDVPATRNPFEIQRNTITSERAANPHGIENPALDAICPTELKIGLPFTPTVSCRIDFQNISLSELTPSKLLAEKLIFSPVPTAKRSLGAISEETTMDIGKELDLYQLELENSINEAKLRKNGGIADEKRTEQSLTTLTEVEENVTITQNVTETTTTEDGHIINQEETVVEIIQTKEIFMEEAKIASKPAVQCEVAEKKEEAVEIAVSNEEELKSNDVEYASDSEDDDLEFKEPAPFVRAYRRAPENPLAVSKESLNSVKSDKSAEREGPKKPTNVKNLIRNSIRKLMHPHHDNSTDKQPVEKLESEKHHNIISSIRHSLRRKPTRQLLVEDESIMVHDISIIDGSERTLKLKSFEPQTEYAKIEQLTNERKHGLRNSIRLSTREMGQQLMKSVFHKKHEEYDFRK